MSTGRVARARAGYQLLRLSRLDGLGQERESEQSGESASRMQLLYTARMKRTLV